MEGTASGGRLLYRAAKGIEQSSREFSEIDKTIGRHQYHSLLEQLTSKKVNRRVNHCVLMADVLEYLLDPVSVKMLFNCRRRKTRRYTQWLRDLCSAVDKPRCSSRKVATHGCFAKEEKRKGGRLERMIAGAMEVVYHEDLRFNVSIFRYEL